MPRSASDGAGIGVAIIDTGIDFRHRDLAPAAQWFTLDPQKMSAARTGQDAIALSDTRLLLLTGAHLSARKHLLG